MLYVEFGTVFRDSYYYNSFHCTGIASVQGQNWGSQACKVFENLVSDVQLIALANGMSSGLCSIRLMDLAKNTVVNDHLVGLGVVRKIHDVVS